MPPNRRKKSKKHRTNAANGVADDDVFEVDDKPIKKRYKASSATRQNLRSSDKPTATNTIDKKHVDVKRNISLSSELKSKSLATVTSDSEESDIEMDIGPRVIKDCTKPSDTEADEPQTKRQKVCDESSTEKENISEKSSPSVVDEPPPTPAKEQTVEKDSDAKTIEDNANSEQIPDNVSEELDYELALEDEDILSDLEPKEASGSSTTENAEVVVTEKGKEIESTDEAENVNQAEAQNAPELQTEAADIENAAIDKELNEEYEDDAPEDLLDLGADLDFSEFDDVSKSPLVQNKNLMNIPRWKKTTMEKDKGAEPIELQKTTPVAMNRPTAMNRVPITTAPSTSALVAEPVVRPRPTAPPTAATAQKPASVFIGKIPRNAQQATNRDPRLVKTITNTNNAAPNTAQATQQSNQNTSSANADDTGERKSVKERLGTKFQTQGLFSNIKNTTSFVIQSNMRLSAAESSAVAGRVDQPIPSIPMSMIKTSENVNRQHVMQPPPVVFPTPPAFARKSKGEPELQLIMPSFATGAQKYEPVFTHLFKTTCRYYMRDCCVKPDCQLEHRMPDHAFFRTEIEKMFQTSIIDLYENYMCRNQKLFDFYIDDFCYYFGKHKLLDNLKRMAEDCAERKVPFHFNSIIDGLMLTGLSFTRAVATLIPSIQCRSNATSKEVLKLILCPRIGNIDPFVQVIESIRCSSNFKFANEWINRLLSIHSQKKSANATFNNTIFELINGVSLEKSARALDQELLTKFIDAFTKSQQTINDP